MCALYIQSSGGIKISTICARKVRTMRMTKKIIGVAEGYGASSFSSCHHKHVFEMRQVDRRGDPRLAVQFADPKALHHADEQTGRKDPAYARGINFRA